jgi:hypothetical protein
MKIDRHNYEEVFILYWDNELTAVEKQAVENFVKQNADLREEFEILGEAHFTPDVDAQFKEKDFLLNNSFINVTNYEEQLLNYIDDEIAVRERKEVEKFVTQNPAAQKELVLFQKTKLQPEAEISFPDKSVLYRREEKVRVISMTWFRVAVAAAIIIIAGLTVFQFVNSGSSGDEGPVAKINTEKDSKKTSIKTPATNPDQNIGRADDKLAQETQKEKTSTKEDKNKGVENPLASTSIKRTDNKINLPGPGKELTVNDKNATPQVVADNNEPTILKKDRNAVQKNESDAINTSFTNTDVTNKSELALYIPEAEEREKDGGGLKEFLRKTTRVFERRTKIQTTTEDNKLLVGAFAVSLK